MGLNARQFEQTRVEMAKNFEMSGLSPETVQADLGFGALDFKNAREVLPSHSPSNVWKLRDDLEKNVLDQGKKPVPFSVLTKNIYYPY